MFYILCEHNNIFGTKNKGVFFFLIKKNSQNHILNIINYER